MPRPPLSPAVGPRYGTLSTRQSDSELAAVNALRGERRVSDILRAAIKLWIIEEERACSK
jgi:hypothetical protein